MMQNKPSEWRKNDADFSTTSIETATLDGKLNSISFDEKLL